MAPYGPFGQRNIYSTLELCPRTAKKKKKCFKTLRLGGVHKLRLQEEGGRWSKKLTFCKLLYHKKCKQMGVGGQKKPNFVNIVCERPLTQWGQSNCVCYREVFFENVSEKFCANKKDQHSI